MPDEALLERYAELRQKAATSRELAELEAEIVAQAQKMGEELGDRRAFFKRRFGGKVTEYETRSAIYRAGPWAFSLFDRIDSGVRMTTVLRQLRISKGAALSKGVDPKEVLQRLSNGLTPSDQQPVVLNTQAMPVASRQFRVGVEALVESYMETLFRNVSEELKNQLVADFKMSLGQLLDEFRVRAVKTKASARDDGLKRIGVDRFNCACEVFGIKTKFGQYINIKWVGRLRIRRLRDLHADRNPSEQARHEYDAVNKAFEILLAYSKQVKKTRGKEDGQE